MNTPRTAEVLTSIFDEHGELSERTAPEKLVIHARQLETELAAMTKERDAFRAAFCNGPAYDTGETPEQARERFEKNGFIDGVSAVIIANELSKELNTEREKVAMLREALLAIDTAIDKTMSAQEAEHGCSRSAVRLRQDATVAKDIAYDLKIKALDASK